MSFKSIIVATCAYALVTTSSASYGAVTYVYTGNPFDTFSLPTSYDASMSVSATITLDSPLLPNMPLTVVTPISYTVTDGISVISPVNATFSTFIFSTDAAANIAAWDIRAQDNTPYEASGDKQRTVLSINTQNPQDVGIINTCVVFNTFAGSCGFITSDNAKVFDASGSWEAVVPVPAAIWLFGSGLLGLIGVARRKVRV